MARRPFSGRLFSGDALATLQREMNRVFEELDLPARSFGMGAGGGGADSPDVDVSETPTALTVRADLPGVAEGDVDVALNDDVLTIRGERRSERREERETFHMRERSTEAFQRSIRLPFPVDPEGVDADFENGVLTVTLPKLRASERSRKIEIRGGRAGGAAAADMRDATTAGGATGGTPMSGSVTGGAGGSAEGAGGFGLIQDEGGASLTGAGAAPSDVEPPVDVENAARPGGAVHGYNE